MLALSSDAFENTGLIPLKYTCEGDNTSPGLLIEGTPTGTKSVALIMDDPDVPKQLRPEGVFDHWVLFNIPPDVEKIPEGGPYPGVLGNHGAGKPSYAGPCPPLEYEPSEHRYFFKLYALDQELDLSGGASKDAVLEALKGHVLEEATLMGRYRKQGK
jgi:Raf kinase inhibitor-like YbhB/YbcL family protein